MPLRRDGDGDTTYKKCVPKETHRKNALLSIVVTRIAHQRRYEEKEKTLFTKSIFPSLVRKYSIRVTSTFYHVSADLSIKLEILLLIVLNQFNKDK